MKPLEEPTRSSRSGEGIAQQSLAPLILSPPVLANGLRRLVQPLAVRKQRNQLNRAEKLYGVRSRFAERPELSGTTQDRHIIRRAVKQPPHLRGVKPRRQVLRRPTRHCRLNYFSNHKIPPR